MTAKQYLGKVHHMRRQCERLERKLQLMWTKAEGLRAMTYDQEKVKTSPTNMLEEAAVEMARIEGRYRSMIEAYARAIDIRTKQIQTLENPIYAEILMMRYIEERDQPDRNGGWQLTLEEIAKDMHYSYDHVARLHGQALQAFQNKYLNDDKKCQN